MNGERVKCEERENVAIAYGAAQVSLNCLLAGLLRGFDMLLGMDAIMRLGGLEVDRMGRICFPNTVACASQEKDREVEIEDDDFSVKFGDGKWTAKWKWSSGFSDPALKNAVSEYRISSESKCQYENEIEKWIANGWLKKHEDEVRGLVPLMAVVQRNKGKVRPVMDFREINGFVSSHTASSSVCGEKLRNWRKLGSDLSVIDLKHAYLQVHIDETLWPYQGIMYKNVQYVLTRLGFGLSVAPKIMSAIVNHVLKSDSNIGEGTDFYIDDIIVDNSKISNEEVLALLSKFGLEAKEPEPIDGGRILGLRVRKSDAGILTWTRDNKIDQHEGRKMTRRQLFALCGQLTGHFPCAGWLRPACSYMKRLANTDHWDDVIPERVGALVDEVCERIRSNDPVKGEWSVSPSDSGIIWCDASSLAEGVLLEIDGVVVEDGCWLRKKDDTAHINLAELESIIKGLNLSISWSLKKLSIKTDSATVFNWLKALLFNEKRIKVKGLGEALVRRRLSMIQDIIEEYGLRISLDLVKSCDNKADELTRVPQRWLAHREVCATSLSDDDIRRRKAIQTEHEKHHFGVEKTLYFIKKFRPDLEVSRQEVVISVRNCQKCKSIDPSPMRWTHGHLSVDQNWTRLAGDVTHVDGRPYLTLVDCGPSRFCIWRRLSNEGVSEVLERLSIVFSEFGPPEELLLDNSSTFRSREFAEFCTTWIVRAEFRCAYKPNGNGIVERNHRTIKKMVARTGKSVNEMTFLYNLAPNVNGLIPHDQIFRNSINYRDIKRTPTKICADHVSIGQRVFVKPRGARCDTPWLEGTITAILSRSKFDIDGVPRHISDIRLVDEETEDSSLYPMETVEPAPCNVEVIDAVHSEQSRTVPEPIEDGGMIQTREPLAEEVGTPENGQSRPLRHARGFFERNSDFVDPDAADM